MNLFSINSPVMRFLERVFDIIVLNLMTLILCIPIVTAGAAITALYKTLFDIRQEKGRTVIGFWQTFRAEFRPAMLLGILTLVATAAYGGYLFLLYPQLAAERAWAWITVAAIGALFFFPMTFIFPLFAKFENTVKKTIVNAFYMSIRHLPVTLIMLVMQAAWLVSMFLVPAQAPVILLAWFFFGIALPAYIGSGLFLRVFKQYAELE